MDIKGARASTARDIAEGEEAVVMAGWLMIGIGVFTLLAALFIRSWALAEIEEEPTSGRARATYVKPTPEQLAAARGSINYAAFVRVVTGVGFVGLGFWAFSTPFLATACGLAAYVANLIAVGMDDWNSVLSSGKTHVAIVVILAIATHRAYLQRPLKEQLDTLRSLDRAMRDPGR
jgi:hypothetical protein